MEDRLAAFVHGLSYLLQVDYIDPYHAWLAVVSRCVFDEHLVGGGGIIVAYTPIDDGPVEDLPLANRLDSLEGSVVALLDGGVSTSDQFLDRLGELFVEQYGVRAVAKFRNAVSGRRLPKEDLDRLVRETDFVVCGVAV